MKCVLIRASQIIFAFLITSVVFNTSYAHTTWERIVGEPSANSVYFGMWSYHLRPGSQKAEDSRNDLLGVVYHGFFAGTLRNSFRHRSWALGIQRNWLSKPLSPNINYSLGYRLGLVHGYDEHLMHLAGQVPFIPFAQIVSDLSYKNVGVELSYTGVVVSGGFFIRF
jgi:hypothetical protein